MLLLLFFTAISSETEAQNRRVLRGDRAFEQSHYIDAVNHYRRAFNRVRRTDRQEAARISFNSGIAFMRLNNFRQAEAQFRRAIRMRFNDPVVYYYLGEVLLSNDKKEEARSHFQQFLELAPEDWRGTKRLATFDLFVEMAATPTAYEVETAKEFNSRRDDLTAAWGDHRASILIFASNREEAFGEELDPWSGQKHSSLFVSYLDRAGNWSDPSLLDEGPVNTISNEGAPSTNLQANELFFTRCIRSVGEEEGCRIYVATRQGNMWTEPTEVVLTTDNTYTVGHPALGPDGFTLYFVSDMPGGLGGMDIWFARRRTAAGSFDSPINMGAPVNTPGNEMFPFVREDGTLYFSSDGHPGFGALDIFYSEWSPAGWSEPVNMGAPVNSIMDDFGIIFRPGANQGFFTSNRRGTRGYDIHSFYLAPVEFTLRGVVRDEVTQALLGGVAVQLIGSDGTLAQTTTNQSGQFAFGREMLRQNTTYEILASKHRYFTSRTNQSTVDRNRSYDFVVDLNLSPIPPDPITLPEILYEFGRWELQPQYRDSLNGLVRTMNDNPGLVIELASHTDSRGSELFNDTLSQLRAQAVVDYLIQMGIHQGRLVAKGYGETNPRNLVRTITRDGFTFREGTTLDEAFINNLPSERQREAAHALNRRTEFRILREDFVPPEQTRPASPAGGQVVPPPGRAPARTR
ncbi:MAG TPA: OmpA family protein [Bacteroidales bacterium]|nr:OmpA family protein [Bacteroidales bacterium]